MVADQALVSFEAILTPDTFFFSPYCCIGFKCSCISSGFILKDEVYGKDVVVRVVFDAHFCDLVAFLHLLSEVKTHI